MCVNLFPKIVIYESFYIAKSLVINIYNFFIIIFSNFKNMYANTLKIKLYIFSKMLDIKN